MPKAIVLLVAAFETDHLIAAVQLFPGILVQPTLQNKNSEETKDVLTIRHVKSALP